MWSILCTGSTICAADHNKIFSGAEIQTAASPGKYYTATGQEFGNDGEFRVDFKTENGHDKHTVFLNAPVAMPTISMHKWNRQGHRTLTDEHGGITTSIKDGTDDPVLCRNGVYFMKLYVDPGVMGKPGFGWQGTR